MLKYAPHDEDIANLALRFENAEPEEILRWAVERYAPDAALTCSFQHEGVVLAHMLQTIAPETPIVFINTGYHFPETLAYRDLLVERLGFNLVEVGPAIAKPEVEQTYGPELFRHDPDRCCEINKVEPLRRALRGVRAWINGRRRDQASTRQALPILEELPNGMVKINPLLRWAAKDTYEYMTRHAIPLNPLFEQGYTSIGCAPCTRKPDLRGNLDDRSGRWNGLNKTECGLHLPEKT